MILLLSCAVFGTAIAIPQQKEQLAEEAFKNITALKGKKASDVIPSMHFMSASLKAECSFCHEGQDYASDAKEMKRTTRWMIEMQNEINEKNFGGKPEVTCATCHSGREHPVSFTPAEGAELRARRDAKVMPADVLAAYGKAVGTASAVRSGLRLEGTSENRGEKGKVSAIFAGDKFRFTLKESKGEQTYAFTGPVFWMQHYQYGLNQIPLEYGQEYLNERRLFLGPDTLLKLSNVSGGSAVIDGKEQNVVTGTLASDLKTRISYFFDKKTGLLSRSRFTYDTVLGTIAQVNNYGNYKKVDGVMVPMRIENHSADKDLILNFTSAKVESKVDPSLFEMPKK
jgi:hypothetical protein